MEAVRRVEAAMRELGLEGSVRTFAAGTATAHEAAAAIGCQPGQVVKTLVFVADGRPALVLVGGDRQADATKVARILGVPRKRLKMASADQVMELTGFDVGAVAPVGLPAPYDVVVDNGLMRYDEVWAAAGTEHAMFRAAPGALVAAIGGQVRPIAKEPA